MRKPLVFALLTSLVLCLFACAPKPNGLEYSLLDLGGDESAILQNQEYSALIDCGSEGSFVRVSQELDRRKITQPDYFFLTHAHSDHCGGAEQVIRHYKPKTIILPETEETSLLFQAVLSAAKTQNCNVVYATANDSFAMGETKINVLAPYRVTYSEENNYSLVLKITHGKRSILHTADAEKLSENEMLPAFDLQADVLKVAHHGSATSTSPAFVDEVNPSYALISVNSQLNPSTPAEETVALLKDTGAILYRTDTNGTITVETDGENLTVKTKK